MVSGGQRACLLAALAVLLGLVAVALVVGLVVAGAEGVDRGARVRAARAQDRRRECRLVRRVREVLGLEGERVALPVGVTARADERAVEEVARVELGARLGRPGLQHAAGGRIGDRRDQLQRGVTRRAIEHEVVVVALPDHDLLVGVADPRADRRRRREVERRPRDRSDHAGRDQRGVDRRVVVGLEPEDVILDRAGALTAEVEVRVVREVDDRRLVGGGVVVHPQLVLVRERVGHIDLQRARIALLAVRARVAELDAAGHDRALPDDLVEALDATVERVGPVVLGQRVRDAVERERAIRDAVGIAPRDRPEVRALGHVVGQVVETERDVRDSALAIRRVDLGDDAAVGDDLHRRAALVRKRELLDGSAIGQGAVGRLADSDGAVALVLRLVRLGRGCRKCHDHQQNGADPQQRAARDDPPDAAERTGSEDQPAHGAPFIGRCQVPRRVVL